jgi:hypothetical protein
MSIRFRWLLGLLLVTSGAYAAAPQTPAQMVAAQQAAMAKFANMDGTWQGTGWMVDGPGDTPRRMTMLYRVGLVLDRTTRVIEIRGLLPDGSLGFHAFNTLGFDPDSARYTMNARAGGRSGAFEFELAPGGFVWRIGTKESGLHYTATFANGEWKETGRAVAAGGKAETVSEFTVTRTGDTDWPDGGAPAPRE